MMAKEMKLVIAGFGGQGVVVAGNILARACMAEGKNITGMVSYGAEMRGGTANSTIVISDTWIASPIVEKPDVAIVLNQPSLDKFEERMAPKGLVVINSSMTEREVERVDLEVIKVNATEIAHQLGNVRVANIVAMGALIRHTNMLEMSSMIGAIEELFSQKKPGLIEINNKALRAGAEVMVSA